MTNDIAGIEKHKKQTTVGSLYYFFTFVGAGSFMIFLNVYFADLGLNGKQIGWLSTLSPLLVVLFSTVIASFADKKRWRVIITQLGLVGVAVFTFLLQFQEKFVTIALFMFLIAIFNSPISAIADSLIARAAQRYNLNYGGMRLWGSLGFVASSLAFGAIWQLFGFKPMFIVATLIYIPLVFITGQMEEGPVIPPEERKPFIRLFKNRGLMLLLLATIFAGTANTLTMIFNGVFARSLGGGNLLIGLMTGIGAIGELPFMYYSDRIGRRFRKANAIKISYVIMALAFLGFTLSKQAAVLPFFNVIKCIGYGLWFPLTIRLFTENTPPEWAASAQSLLTISMFGISQLVAGPIGGAIYDAISPNAVYAFGIICFILALIVLSLAARKTNPLIADQ